MVSPSPSHRRKLFASRYAIRRKLGSGSLGTVYLARDEASGRAVALKVIHADRLTPDAVARMQDEFRAIAALEHRQLARAYDFGYTEDGVPYYTREYIEGTPLPPGPPGGQEPSRCLRPIIDLLDALAYVHDNGILHLDIHSDNLIVAADDRRGGVLIDLGLTGSLRGVRFSTRRDDWSFLAPEILEGGTLSARTDLFLAGRLLLWVLTGRVEEEPRLPREIPGWGTRLTLELERIAAKALRPSPGDRFASATDFREALAAAIGDEGRSSNATEPQNVLVGRDNELAELERLLQQAGAGGAGAVWLVGGEGAGKTRLLDELRRNAQLRGLRTVAAAFFPDHGPENTLPRLLRLVEPRRSRRWIDALSPRHGGTPRERARRAAEAYFSTPGEALVVLLDDIEAADGESRTLAEALIAECRRRADPGQPGRGLALIVAGTDVPESVDREIVRRLHALRPAGARKLLHALVRPLDVPAGLARRAVEATGGWPLLIRRTARALREEWGSSGLVPETAALPDVSARRRLTPASWQSLPPRDRETLETLAVIGRAASAAEIAVGIDAPLREIVGSLRRLVRSELVVAHGRGRSRAYRIDGMESASEIGQGASDRRARAVHARLVASLEQQQRGPAEDEHLARHLIRAGRRSAGLRVAFQAARSLREGGLFERAMRLLEEVGETVTDPARRLELAEAISELAEETGDHEKGAAVLEPLVSSREIARDDAAVRVRRRLGIHYHRAGFADRALAVFDEARRLADTARDIRDLVFIDTELAEVHLFRGSYDQAEEACRRGLDRIAGEPRDEFRGAMEVMLRASLGHIELRRLRPKRARTELRAALELSRRHGTTADRAAILHNLAIVENQLNLFPAARRRFREAERLLLGAGEQRNVIKIGTNLAVIAAKLGEVDEAFRQLDRASEMARRFPDPRLEFFVAFSRGIVLLMTGRPREAIAALEPALALGRKLDDEHLVAYGEVQLAEAHLLCGRYSSALKQLVRTGRRTQQTGGAMLRRMIQSRLYLIHSLLGRARAAGRALAELDRIPRAEVELPEAWSDIFVGLGHVASGKSATELLDGARRTMERLRVPFGGQFARLALLVESFRAGERAIVARLGAMEDGGEAQHPFLASACALLRAEAAFRLGRLETARGWLATASDAIVGSPFLELDWAVELLRVRLAVRDGDIVEARRHMHRSEHSRELLLQFVPPRDAERFVEHARFDQFRELKTRLGKPPRVAHSTPALARAPAYEGIVGASAAIGGVIQAIEQLCDQDLPVVISGESGTGKELVARAIYRRSTRRLGPFMALACAALPEELIEAELYGYAAGAFTGADEDRPGILEQIHGGTLLLDSIEELPLAGQAKLLHALDEGAVRRLGSIERVAIDVRVIASTRLGLAGALEKGTVREDLYYRLRGVEIVVPPLRERREDIPLLARHFLDEHARRLDRPAPSLESAAWSVLERHDWPGNVRELETLLLRASLQAAPGNIVRAADIEALLVPSARAPERESLLGTDLDSLRADLERRYITELFLETGGDQKAMMKRLGVGRTKLYEWLRALGLDIRELRGRLRG